MTRIVLSLMAGFIISAGFSVSDAQAPRLQASGRAATAVCLNNQCRMTDTSLHTVLIEYGQTHARGREVWGVLVPLDTVWRLGANSATHLISRVPLTIGGTQIPAGKYTLYLRPTAAGGQLVVSDTTGIWGTTYVAARDRARIPMRSRNLAENMESLTIALVPDGTAPNSGLLQIVWGKREFSVNWTAQIPAGRSGQSDGR